MELYKLQPNNYDFITKGDIMYSCRYLVNIPVLSYINGDLYLHVDISIINDIKRVLKKLSSENVNFFLYTPNLEFNVDITHPDTSYSISSFIVDSIVDKHSLLFNNLINNDLLNLNNTLIPYLIKYNQISILSDYSNELLIKIEDIKKNPYLYNYK